MRSLAEIEADMIEESYYTQRHECTPRVMARMDLLLDEYLEVRQVVSDFERVFNYEEMTDGPVQQTAS